MVQCAALGHAALSHHSHTPGFVSLSQTYELAGIPCFGETTSPFCPDTIRYPVWSKTMRFIAVVLVWAFLTTSTVHAGSILAEGLDSNTSFSNVPIINTTASAAAFYGSASPTDYVGLDPIVKADLMADTAHLFFVNTQAGTLDDLTLFIVYQGDLDQDIVTSVLDSPTDDFIDTDYLIKDGPQPIFMRLSAEIFPLNIPCPPLGLPTAMLPTLY